MVSAQNVLWSTAEEKTHPLKEYAEHVSRFSMLVGGNDQLLRIMEITSNAIDIANRATRLTDANSNAALQVTLARKAIQQQFPDLEKYGTGDIAEIAMRMMRH